MTFFFFTTDELKRDLEAQKMALGFAKKPFRSVEDEEVSEDEELEPITDEDESMSEEDEAAKSEAVKPKNSSKEVEKGVKNK